MKDTDVKLCLWCKHLDIIEGFCGSEVTGSTPDEYACDKDHWFSLGSEVRDFRETMRKAQTCPDYELSPEITGG